jgi:hypothetical protein
MFLRSTIDAVQQRCRRADHTRVVAKLSRANGHITERWHRALSDSSPDVGLEQRQVLADAATERHPFRRVHMQKVGHADADPFALALHQLLR